MTNTGKKGYWISGKIWPGTSSVSFFPSRGGCPHVTISNEMRAGIEVPDDKPFVCKVSEDRPDWHHATVKKITREMARAVLAHINGVTPDDVEIVERGLPAFSISG